ncbi:MAG: hydantoinase/oxoprolinase family protein, partial [Rhodobacteraceae bacterium]|nr:hydantoinase/oxoprolinase family protein [Paracoccaceae bacterium]
RLSVDKAAAAVATHVGDRLNLSAQSAAFGICEVVDENMANAARVHAVENGKNISDNTMIAFGGAAPLHAARLCEKLGIDRCLIPPGAGVGSAIGFLKAPFGYESLASRIIGLSSFDPATINDLVSGLKATAQRFVAQGTRGTILTETVAFMRYRGQGWEIPVPLPDRAFTSEDAALIRDSFLRAYARFFGRAIDGLSGLEIEIVTISVKAADQRPAPAPVLLTEGRSHAVAPVTRPVFDPATGQDQTTGILERSTLALGARVSGPVVVVERETSTVVTSPFDVVMQDDGSLLLIRKGVSK